MAIDGLSLNQGAKSNYLLFLPDQELHEIGLLLANYLIRANGGRTFYLGQSVPLIDLEKVSGISKPDYLVTFLVTPKTAAEIERYLHELQGIFKESTVLVSGYGPMFDQVNLPEKTIRVTSPEHLLDFVS